MHVRADSRGKGFGRILIEALFPRATALGMHTMIGHIESFTTANRDEAEFDTEL